MSHSSVCLTFQGAPDTARPAQAEPERFEDTQVTAEWSLPARHVFALVLAVLALSIGIAIFG